MIKNFFNFWLLTTLCFWAYALFLNQGPDTPKLLGYSVMALIIMGIIFFCLFLMYFRRRYRFIKTILVALVLIILTGGISVWALGEGSKNNQLVNNQKANSPIITPTQIQPSVTPMLKKKQKVVVQPTLDLDQPVHCNIHPNCGGGTKPLKKSECDNSICCQIEDDWIFYKDKIKCKQDQEKYWNSNERNYVPPEYNYDYDWQPLPTFAPYPTYSYQDQNEYTGQEDYLTQEELEALQDEYAQLVTKCKNEVSAYYGEKLHNCDIQYGASSAAEACKHIYENEMEQLLKDCEEI